MNRRDFIAGASGVVVGAGATYGVMKGKEKSEKKWRPSRPRRSARVSRNGGW